MDARDTYDDFETRGFLGYVTKKSSHCGANPLNSDLRSLGDKLKNKLKSSKNSKILKILKPSQTSQFKFSNASGHHHHHHYPVYHDPRLEDHLIQTAGILWGLRRREFDAELEELQVFGRDLDFLVGRDTFRDSDLD